MGVKAGYKQTEVGVIPEDWDERQIGDFQPFVTSGSRGWAEFYSETGDAFIRITNLTRICIYPDITDLRFVTLKADDSEGLRTQLYDGDVLISITADIGIIGYVTSKIPKPAYINQHIALVRFHETKADSQFLSYFLASENPQKLFRAMTDSGAKAGMNLTTVKQIKVATPPNITEQRAISVALSDADALIESLEQLIHKKRQIKQGAMQELLTGKKRLPGFSGEWEVKRLGDVASLKNGYAFKSDTYTELGEYKVITIANVQDGYMSDSGCSRVDSLPEDLQEHHRLKIDEILISMTGNVGRVCRVNSANCLLNQRVGKIYSSVLHNEFLFYLLRQRSFLQAMVSSAVGGAQGNLSSANILDHQFRMPFDFSEQEAIATILSDMDAELAALEEKLGKAKSVKQGMMQELLTGRVRLV